MIRRIVQRLPVVSVILCIASAIAWVGSIGRFDHLSLRREEVAGATPFAYRNSTTYWLYSSSGFLQMGLDSWQYNDGPKRPSRWSWLTSHNHGLDVRTAWILSGFWRGGPLQKSWRCSIEFSYAFLILLFAIPPVVAWLIGNRKKRLRAMHLCRTCGYDLRATPERCPECGAAVEKSEIRSQKSEGNPKEEIPN